MVFLLCRNPPGSAAAGLSSQKHGSKQSMMRDAGFREAPWQRLHVVSLNLMRQAVRMAHRQRVGASSACDDRDAGFQAASNGCIDLTSDSHKSSDSGPEALTQVGRASVTPTIIAETRVMHVCIME